MYGYGETTLSFSRAPDQTSASEFMTVCLKYFGIIIFSFDLHCLFSSFCVFNVIWLGRNILVNLVDVILVI